MAQAAAALPDDAPHLLVVDDDRRIRDLLSRFLFAEGYRVTTADNAADGARQTREPVVRSLDPRRDDAGRNRLQLAKSLRETSVVPILMLTAKAETESRITGLEIGADDYVPKPFEPRELSLRIASILRRTIVAPTPTVESVRFGDFVFHLGRGELRRGEEVIHLTDRRARHAARARGCAGRNRAAPCARRNGGGANERAVDVQVNRLRRKIERDPAIRCSWQTVRGIGYRLVVSP